MKFLAQLGAYLVFVRKVFTKPEKWRLFFKSTLTELDKLGFNSVSLVVIISFFIGAALTLQTAYNMNNPLMPRYLIGFLTRETLLLEFSSTVISLILVGKIGSSIASEIGTMKITEQIEALETMGVASESYLIAPKLAATLFINPVLYIFSVFIGIIGGLVTGVLSGVVNFSEFVSGVQFMFNDYYVVYSVIKTLFFAFIFTTIPAYYAYNVKGGSLEVGQASTKSVVHSSIAILATNLILTKLLL
ncbi:ABC transporter permease [Bacteroidia bacterium]|nr:ABC transporter permease [Bacteroidia bacterium]